MTISSVTHRGAADDHSPRDPQRPAQRAGRACRRAPRSGEEPRHQGSRPGLARVREAGSGRDRAVRRGFRAGPREPHPWRAPAARHRRGLPMRRRAKRCPVEVRRCRVPRRRRCGRDAPGRRHRGQGREASGEHRGSRGQPDRPERGAGAGRGGPPRADRTAGPADAGVQLRPQRAPRQRPAAPAPGTREGPAAGPCCRADAQVPRDAELVPRAPRPHRQRLQLLRGPARTGPHDELHPLRPR